MSRRARWVTVIVAAAVLLLYWFVARRQPGAADTATKPTAPPVTVSAANVRRGDLPVYLTGLGSVVAYNTVTVKSRVDGQIVNILFQEGQLVHQGDVLVEIDPRPFQVQLEQAQGALARDEAQLKDAELTLVRYQDLYKQKVISKQELDDQVAKRGQFEGAVKADVAAVDSAKLNLDYAHVTAPITGRAGLRLVDVGNIVHATDTTGIVLLTQMQPITAVFTLPEDELPRVLARLSTGEQLPVEAFDRSGQTKIATGHLLTADNRIDPGTGTTRLKAVFDNENEVLFPNQFVNVRLQLDVRKEAVIAPVAAIQRGPQGTFVYVVKPDKTVDVRQVKLGPTTEADAVIESGLTPAEQVVVRGVDRLRPGSLVDVQSSGPTA
jgi:multidrug efflux system membrane fusion protein